MLALGWKDATIVVKEKQSFSAGQVEWQLGWGHFGSRLLPLCCFPTHPQPRKDLAMVELEMKTKVFSSGKMI